MVVPLVALGLGLMGAGMVGNTISSLYQQNNYRQYTNEVNKQNRQWISDFERNTGRKIRYDKLPNNAAGSIYQSENLGIPNSYAQSWGTAFSGFRSVGAMGLGYRASKHRYTSAYSYNTNFRGGAKRWV